MSSVTGWTEASVPKLYKIAVMSGGIAKRAASDVELRTNHIRINIEPAHLWEITLRQVFGSKLWRSHLI